MILLVNAPSRLEIPTLPIGLAYLASYLEKNHIPVNVIDAWAEGIGHEEVAQRAAEISPGIIGISMTTPNYENVKKTVESLRRRLPSARIVLGGAHPSAVPADVLNEMPEADMAVVGEGEITFVELIKAIEEGVSDLSNIDGIAFRHGASVKVTKRRSRIKNLDELPFPDRKLFPVSRYRSVAPFGRRKPYIPLISSRGCPYPCRYCSKDVFGDDLRLVSAKKIIEEIRYLMKEYSVKEIRFYDDIFTLDKSRLAEMCEFFMKERGAPTWSCLTRVELVDEKTLSMMKKARCWLIAYGVESAESTILKSMGRVPDLEPVRRAFRMTRNAGMRTLGYFMLGFPDETASMMRKTIDFAVDLDPDYASFSALAVMPGSAIYRSLIQDKGLSAHPRFTESKAPSLGFMRHDRSYVNALSIDELGSMMAEAHRRFYFRPSYLAKRLLNIRSIAELCDCFETGGDIASYVFKSRPMG